MIGGTFMYHNAAKIKKAFALALTHQPEPLTELYFEDHTNLPQTIELGEKQSFRFTIHNLEYTPTTYTYEISSIDDVSNITFATGSTTLAHDAFATTAVQYIESTTSGRVKIQVSLVGRDQSIHYWME
jgi:hypothetical protein